MAIKKKSVPTTKTIYLCYNKIDDHWEVEYEKSYVNAYDAYVVVKVPKQTASPPPKLGEFTINIA